MTHFKHIMFSIVFFSMNLTGVSKPGMAMDNSIPIQERPKIKPIDFDRFEVREWGALGSGCRGGGAGAGNITVEIFHDLSASHRYRFLIQTHDYDLDGARPIAPDLPTFAKECAVRFSIYPEPGFKVVDASAHTGFEVKKQKDVEVRLQSSLSIGAHITRTWSALIPKHSKGPWGKTVQLLSRPSDRKKLQSRDCAEPLLLGLDLSMTALRSDLKKEVQIRMKNGQVEIILEMGACQSRQVAESSSSLKS